ncbi:tetratricopeptide repeat protein [endosymbiont of Riftia pachyptila]|uniref:tetratricopeptide repeat protein n=1 Tax=endosymbiont of Riftia pachyptila TaxID=54396 RepID=UPI001F11D3D8|nr:tetratricopeptide repeat protein [endosymbiont of Riftia pachyptila]
MRWRAAKRELLQDTLRVVSLSFIQLGGAAGIDRYFRQNGGRGWLHRVYRSLGDLYLKQQRILDAAGAYLAFVRQHPSYPQAPGLQLLAIDNFTKHGFPSQALAAKQELAERYRLNGPAWRELDPSSRAELTPHLRRHLRDLAAHYHALVQQKGKASKAQRDAWFEQAVAWYRHYLVRFPGEAESGAVNFLLAELLFERGAFNQAVVAYQRSAYDYPPHKDAAEAGYAALLAFEKQTPRLPEAQRPEWQRQAAESGLRFADRFGNDPRAAKVLSRSAQQLFELGDYARARTLARRSLKSGSSLEQKAQRVSWMVAAHAAFELADYVEAEVGYSQLLQLPGSEKNSQGMIREKLAAAIYQQGRAQREKGATAAAARHFLRVGQVVPGATIRATAEYDAAASLIAASRWAEAAEVLEAFRRRYPKHESIADVQRKLALVYLQDKQPLQAAAAFERVAATPQAIDVQRQAAWQAAELYQQAGSGKQAVTAFKRYVKRFPEPQEPAMEARQRLVELYQQQDQSAKRDYWLRQLVVTQRKAGQASSERSRYLAAHAALRLAEPEFSAFERIPLKRPLARSLKQKKAQMQRAIQAFELAAGFAQAGVTTQATFRLAEIYRLFGESLLHSERPAGLSAVELEQYELLLEEQAFPFEERAIEAHQVNARRAAQGSYDAWVRQSFERLAALSPARYAKQEQGERVFDALR